MRPREEIENNREERAPDELRLEVLLDIRSLLSNLVKLERERHDQMADIIKAVL